MSTYSPVLASLNVALGGAIGAVLRYQLGRGMTWWLGPQMVSLFPWATLAANAVGSLAMGLLAGWLAFRSMASLLVRNPPRGERRRCAEADRGAETTRCRRLWRLPPAAACRFARTRLT